MFDPEHPTLKSRMAAGECLALAWLTLGSVAMAEAVARARPDAIVIDMQHGLWERRDLESAIGLIPRDLPVIVRVAENSPLAIGTALDAGAEGVMVPLVETLADAKRALQSSRYPPRGKRSGGGVRPLQNFAAYVKNAGELVVILMIETAAGLANASAIAQVKGLDMVFIGTGDMALSLQAPGGQAQHTAACERIQRACRAASVRCGVFTGSAQSAAEHRALGYDMVVVANDMDVVSRGFADACEAFRQSAPRAPARVAKARLPRTATPRLKT